MGSIVAQMFSFPNAIEPDLNFCVSADVRTFAEHIGIRLPAEDDLLWIAQCALKAALPPPWLPVEDSEGERFIIKCVVICERGSSE